MFWNTKHGRMTSGENQQTLPKTEPYVAEPGYTMVSATYPGKDGIGADVTVKRKRKPKPKKYSKGPKIQDMHELVSYLEFHDYVMWGDRPCHKGWIVSMTFRTLENLVRGGRFHRAEKNPPPKKGFFEKAHLSIHPQEDQTHRCGHPDCAGFDPERA